MQQEEEHRGIFKVFDKAGRFAVSSVKEVGYGGSLLAESVFWLFAGPRVGQPVRLHQVFAQMMEVGIMALPIVAVMSATIGVMLAIQGIYSLRIFGAESQVTFGIAYSVVREFAALITGILVAGRSGAAFAARLGTMTINQEVDALQVMAINPVRYLVVPALLAMVIMMPLLTLMADLCGLLAAGLYVRADLGISLSAFFDQVLNILSVDDLLHGLAKSAIFAALITIIGIGTGASVHGGAEGVGRVTTRAVVQSISAIIVTDMIFAFIATR